MTPCNKEDVSVCWFLCVRSMVELDNVHPRTEVEESRSPLEDMRALAAYQRGGAKHLISARIHSTSDPPKVDGLAIDEHHQRFKRATCNQYTRYYNGQQGG